MRDRPPAGGGERGRTTGDLVLTPEPLEPVEPPRRQTPRRRVQQDDIPVEQVSHWLRGLLVLVFLAVVGAVLWQGAVPPVYKEGLRALVAGLLAPPGPAAGTAGGTADPRAGGMGTGTAGAGTAARGPGPATAPATAVDRTGSPAGGGQASGTTPGVGANPAGTGAGSDAQASIPDAPPVPPTGAEEIILLVGGDIRLAGGMTARLGQPPDPLFPFGSLAPLLRGADLAVANLEGVIATVGEPRAAEIGESYRMPPAAVATLAAAGFDALGLANDHASDYGPEALQETLALLRAGQIAYFGAGANLQEAATPLILTRGGTRIALIGFTDLEPLEPVEPPATPEAPGVLGAEAGPLEAAIRQAREEADVVVVLAHWGPEFSPVPSARQRQLARLALAAGADLVLGSGPQVEQTVEWLLGKPVVYSLGNLAVEPAPEREGTSLGVLARVAIRAGRVVGLEILRLPIAETGEPGLPAEPAEAAEARYWLELRGQWLRLWQGMPGAVHNDLVRAALLPEPVSCPASQYQVAETGAEGIRLQRVGYANSQFWITGTDDPSGCARLPAPLLDLVRERLIPGSPVEVPLEREKAP